MRIAYCTNVRLPSERAHGHQVAQVCDALAGLGHEVTIFAPYRKNVVRQDYWTYYGVLREVKLRHLGSTDFIALPFPGAFRLWLLNRSMRSGLRRELHAGAFDLLYTRSPALLPAMLATGIPTVLELHQLPRWGQTRFVTHARRCALVACLTSPMRDVLVQWGVPRERLIVEGDAVDLKRFATLPERRVARETFGVRTGRTVVGYVGRLTTLGMEKGVAHLLEALAMLRSESAFFGFIVGGPENDRRRYEEQARSLGLTKDDVQFTGEIPSADVPAALAACDILAMPFPDFPHYRLHMSPLKMFEYMAAERPIVTSDLPTVRDVLSEESAVFCKPGDVRSLVDALAWIRAHPDAAAARAHAARERVKNHTWEERMARILSAASRARA